MDLWQEYRKKIQSKRSSSLALRLVDQLFSYPAISLSWTAKLLNVTRRTAQLNVEKLVAAGILEEATGRKRNRVFVAPEIIQIIEASKAE
jgi:Fic family protein